MAKVLNIDDLSFKVGIKVNKIKKAIHVIHFNRYFYAHKYYKGRQYEDFLFNIIIIINQFIILLKCY